MFALKHTKYAPLGADVTVYNKEHDPVWLCEYNVVKFPIHKDYLTDEEPIKKEEVKHQLSLF